MSVLALDDLRAGYGGTSVLHGVSLRVDPGEIVVVIGPNGTGKSTAMKPVFGLLTVHSGRVTLGDRDITGLKPGAVAGAGAPPATSISMRTATCPGSMPSTSRSRTAPSSPSPQVTPPLASLPARAATSSRGIASPSEGKTVPP